MRLLIVFIHPTEGEHEPSHVSLCLILDAAPDIEGKKVKLLSHVPLFASPWTVAYPAPPSMEFSRQEYWNGFPFPSPGHLLNPGMEPGYPAL